MAYRATILALHGFTGVGDDFSLLQSQTPDYQWVTPNLMGGKAPVFNTVGAAINAIDTPFILLGYSMGGRIAYHFAAKYQYKISAFIQVGTTPGIADPVQRHARFERDSLMADRIEAIGTEAFINEWNTHPLIQSQSRINPTHKAQMHQARLKHNSQQLAALLREVGTAALDPTWDSLSSLNIPVTLISGAEDIKFIKIAQEVQSHLPHAEHHVIPDAGHAAHLENLSYFLNILEKTIEKTVDKAIVS